MVAIPFSFIVFSLLAVVLYLPCVDWWKIIVFRLTHIS
jgi:hypothetical protein